MVKFQQFLSGATSPGLQVSSSPLLIRNQIRTDPVPRLINEEISSQDSRQIQWPLVRIALLHFQVLRMLGTRELDRWGPWHFSFRIPPVHFRVHMHFLIHFSPVGPNRTWFMHIYIGTCIKSNHLAPPKIGITENLRYVTELVSIRPKMYTSYVFGGPIYYDIRENNIFGIYNIKNDHLRCFF